MPTVPLVSFIRVSARHHDTLVFSNLTFSVFSHGHLAVLGPNGSGKSTLLRMMQGDLRQPQESPGLIQWGFDGQADSSPLEPKKHARLASGLLHTHYLRKGWRITGEEVVLAGFGNTIVLYGPPAPDQQLCARNLAARAGAEELLDMPVTAMSQGQMKLTLLLRALVASPRLLLLDEPFEGLSAVTKKAVLPLLEEAARNGSTIVLTAHRQEDIPPFINRIVPLPELIGADAQHPPCGTRETLQTDGQNSLSGCPVSFCRAMDALIDPGTCPERQKVPPPPVLSLTGVTVYIDHQPVLQDLSWTVEAEQQWVVTGGNGAGKSTLLRLLYGEEFAAFGGTMLFCGTERPPLPAFRQLVGYVSDSLQHRYAYDLPAEEVVISGRQGAVGIYHSPAEEEQAQARALLDFFGLLPMAQVPFHALSSGMARRLLLARAMACSPSMLLLDEPCAGLDPASRETYLSYLQSLAARGMQLFYVSHYPQEIPPCFTHELALRNGRITYAGPRPAKRSLAVSARG